MTRATWIILILFSVVVALFGAGLSYWALDPVVGIDDANITHAYARNIAQGHGYVYNIGGERVEGSTSPLWTLINVLAFMVSRSPELGLAAVCFAMTVGVFCLTMHIGYILAPRKHPVWPALCAAAFGVFPAIFGWLVWSLMDITLWVFLLTLTVWTLLRLTVSEMASQKGLFCFLAACAFLLPLTRPEGAVVVLALALFYGLRARFEEPGARMIAMITATGGVVAICLGTILRMMYFSYPVPNTFYAKTSTDISGQLTQGVEYIVSYLHEPQNILFLTLFCVAGGLLTAFGQRLQQRYFWLVCYLLVGGGAVYLLLGGDHFGSHRQFIYFLPIGIPIIVSAAASMIDKLSPGQTGIRRLLGFWLIVPCVLVGLASQIYFIQFKGNLRIEFDIAQAGQSLGARLNNLPERPSIGVFAAGGLRMTYEGEVKDLLGLNWLEMAHAADDAFISDVPSQRGFNSNVFWMSPPDVFPVFPSDGICPDDWQPLSGYLDAASDGISHDPEFRSRFGLYCNGTDVFYADHRYVARVIAETGDFPFHNVAD